MQAGQLIAVRTNPATQFTGALAQNAALTENLAMNFLTGDKDGYVDPGLGAGKTVKSRLRSLDIVSVENLAWELWLWGKDTFNASLTNPALVYPLGRWAFTAGMAVQIAGAGLWYYYIDGLDQSYLDLDSSGEIHLMLVNRSVAAKTADAGGAIMIQLNFENTYGQ